MKEDKKREMMSLHLLSIKRLGYEKDDLDHSIVSIVGRNSKLKTDSYQLRRLYKNNTLLFNKYLKKKYE